MDLKDFKFFKDKDISIIRQDLNSIIAGDTSSLYRLIKLDKDGLALADYKKKEYDDLKDIDDSYRIDFYFEDREDGSYLISESPKDFKEELSDDQIIEVGKRIGEFIYKFHNKNLCDKSLWDKLMNNRINLFTYNYNMSPFKSERAYIVFDFLNENKYVLEDRQEGKILNFNRLDNIKIGKDLSFFIDTENATSFTDPFYEFRSFNVDDDLLLLKYAILRGYFSDKIPRLFYRILAIYTIEDIISNKYFSDPNADITDEIDKILAIYDDFETLKPGWIMRLEERLNSDHENRL
ncbi:MAG: hypothetical protein SPI59_02990 [Finegoldia sp.]|nr:hypothetical protein [Finegoldia sp.]